MKWLRPLSMAWSCAVLALVPEAGLAGNGLGVRLGQAVVVGFELPRRLPVVHHLGQIKSFHDQHAAPLR